MLPWPAGGPPRPRSRPTKANPAEAGFAGPAMPNGLFLRHRRLAQPLAAVGVGLAFVPTHAADAEAGIGALQDVAISVDPIAVLVAGLRRHRKSSRDGAKRESLQETHRILLLLVMKCGACARRDRGEA